MKTKHLVAAATITIAAIGATAILSTSKVGPAWIYPNAALTPGTTNSTVTQDNIQQTICVPGWTASIRPGTAYTTALKKLQLANGYALNGDMNPANYEEDHFISLELGGNPMDSKNLWPEPYLTPGAHEKDRTENYLKSQVCAGKMTLLDAQKAITTDWYKVYTESVMKSNTFGANPISDPDDE